MPKRAGVPGQSRDGLGRSRVGPTERLAHPLQKCSAMKTPARFGISILLAGCNGEEIAQSCGEQSCPVGTAFEEYRAVREGFDLDLGLEPASYSGEIAFSTFGEGECSYQCVTINPCPEETFPVIDADCFTCGAVTSDGEVVQGACE